MKKTIGELFFGNIAPFENRGAYEEKAKFWKGIDEKGRGLEKILDEGGCEILEKYHDDFMDILNFEKRDSFIDGFSLGVRLLIEVLEN